MKQIVFQRRNELLRVPLDKAVFFESYGNYCYGVFTNKQRVVLPVGLGELEKLLRANVDAQQPVFLRIGKRYIVNADMIVQVSVTHRKLVLSDFDHPGHFDLPISEAALKEIKRLSETHELWK